MSSGTKHVESLHPSIIDKLDPEYVAFHNAHLINRVPPELLPWDPKIRLAPTVPGTSDPLEVGGIQDYSVSKTNVRVFTPKGHRPAKGWPVFIWFHGGSFELDQLSKHNSYFHIGGWTLGNITSDTSFISRMVNSTTPAQFFLFSV